MNVTSSSMKVLLIDAYAMIYRAYYAFIRSPRITSKGENLSAVFGFALTLDDLLRKLQPTHVAVAFDPKGPTFRHEAYPEYKAQRQETPEDIHRAVPVIRRLLEAMRITEVECAGFEADDVIGTLAKQAEQQGAIVWMATPDKDYGQLVSEKVLMYRPEHSGGFVMMGPEEVCRKYDLQHPQQVIDLLALMGDSSDNVPGCKGIGEKGAVKLISEFGSVENLLANTDKLKGATQQKVSTQREQILFSKFLVTIRTDAPVQFDAEQMVRREPDMEKLTALYRELEFNTLLSKLPKAHNVATPSDHSASPSRSLTVSPVTAQLDLFGELSSPVSEERADAGTTTDDMQARLCAYLLNPEQPYNPQEPPQWERLQADPALWNLYQEVELPLVEVLRDMEKAGVRFDATLLKEAEQTLGAELATIEQKVVNTIHQMLEERGLPIVETLNINSPKQLGELLFEQLRLDGKAKRSRNGNYSTSEEVLQGLKHEHPVIGDLLEYRSLKKLISTYIAPLPSYINPATGKIHTTYNQTVTATGRLSSSNPNLQNLPIRSERGQLIRRAVIADEGCLFVSADYSQIELRLMAHFSQDEHLLQAFRQGQDIHAATAAKIFGVPLTEVTKDQRRKAKTANFGILYGISAFGLAQQLDCSRSEAKKLIEDYFAAFPKVVAFIETQKIFAREHGYVETLFGRKRYLPDIHSANATVRAFAERNAVNAPIQGTAADIIKIAMVSIHRELKERQLKAQMIMQVHDELNFNVPEPEVETVRKIVSETMQNAVHLTVPLTAECGVGKNWLEAH